MKLSLLVVLMFLISCGQERPEYDQDLYQNESNKFYKSCTKKEEEYCCMTKLRYYQYTFLNSDDFITESEVRVVCRGTSEQK